MSGLSRYDFYPRDWFLDTRNLSNAAKGIYVDLFSAMYARGGPLPYDEQELCGLCGCKTVRSLRPLLQELIDKEKIHAVDGFLVNNRTMEEIAAVNKKIEDGRRGGRPPNSAFIENMSSVRGEYTPNTAGTHAETKGTSVEKQRLNQTYPSPSPSSLSSSKKGAGAPAGGKGKERGNGPDQDPVKVLFDLGVSLLTGAGVRERQARSLVGRWRGKIGDEALAGILVAANRATEPVAYVEKAIQNKLQPRCETFI